MFLALGVLDRLPVVPYASHSCVRRCVRATLAQLLGSALAVWRSPTRCALAVTVSIPFLDSSAEL